MLFEPGEVVRITDGPFNDFKTWSGIPAVTLWMKVFIDYIISRQAHPMLFGRKKAEKRGFSPCLGVKM